MKDWRPRYFILKDNGEFIGYKKEPSTEANLNNILNNFTGKLGPFAQTCNPSKWEADISMSASVRTELADSIVTPGKPRGD